MLALLLCALLAPGAVAQGIDLQDLVRIKGQEQNELTGMGLVVGLNGTGDETKRSKRLARPLFELYRHHGLGLESLSELDGVDSVAIVFVSCRIPGTGAREGDLFDAHVSVAGDASNLRGGQLVWTVMRPGPQPEAYAIAKGQLEIDPANPRNGIVRDGVQMRLDIRTDPINPADGSATLVLHDVYAGLPMAKAIAERVNQEFDFGLGALGGAPRVDAWAELIDAKNVQIRFASWVKDDALTVLARIMRLDVDLSLLDVPARVVIDRANGVIVLHGDVQISPTIISSRNLTITRIAPPPIPSAQNPVFSTESHVAIGQDTAFRPGQNARLQDLLTALESLKAPFEERVSILHTMHETGVLHAELIEVN